MDEEKDIQELYEKSENQLSKIEPVEKALADMGTIWKIITAKLNKDGFCVLCKKEFTEDTPFDIIPVPDTKTEKGTVVFVSCCKGDC